MPEVPHTNDVGLFEPLIGKASESWPWALPHFYAVNTAPESGEVVVSASADPSGAYREEEVHRDDKGRLEIVGYWRGSFRVAHAYSFGSIEKARQVARENFEQLPIRLLMEGGSVKTENSDVVVSGVWPSRWEIKGLRDLGVLSAYLWEAAGENGGRGAAEEFRALLRPAIPATEQLLVYVRALESARASLAPFLFTPSLEALDEGLHWARKWIR